MTVSLSVVADLVAPDSAAWRQALGRVPHDVYHLAEYAALEARLGGGTAACYAFEEAGDVLLVPLILRDLPDRAGRYDAASPYGYPGPVSSTDEPTFWNRGLRGLVEALRAAGAVTCFLRLHPLLPPPGSGLDGIGTVVGHGQTVAMNLSLDDTEIWRQVRGNHRRQIHRSRRADRRVVFDDWSRLPDFRSLYDETMRRVGACDSYLFPADYYDGLRTALGDRLHLATVMNGNEVICASLLTECDGIVEYHLGATATAHLNEQPTKLLFDEAWRWAKQRGNHWFHLGGGVGGAADSLFHFKAGFSQARFTFSTMRVIVDHETYAALSGADPGTGHFPSYRRPAGR